MRLNTVIKHLDPTLKRLRSNSGEEFECEHLLLATGAQARKLDGRGNEVDNVFYLRSLKDSGTIRSRSAGAKAAVIIGGGFIGMEVASVLAQSVSPPYQRRRRAKCPGGSPQQPFQRREDRAVR